MPYNLPVIRFIPQLKKTLKSPTIAQGTLDTYDEYFRSILMTYPDILQPQSDQPLEPFWLQAVFPLQAARLLLYRHNLTTLCSPRERTEALHRCLSAAYDTLSYISRCIESQPSGLGDREGPTLKGDELRNSIRVQADNFVCKHIWRTTLILCFKGDYKGARICVSYSLMIGDARKVNIACGRNLSYFLERLHQRMTSGPSNTLQLELDEEMIAYASGDLQGDPDNAWVWAGGDVQTEEATSGPDGKQPLTALLTENELKEWGGWDRIEVLLRDLMEEQEKQSRESHPYHRPSHNTTKRLHLSPEETPSPTPPAGASRISIANII